MKECKGLDFETEFRVPNWTLEFQNESFILVKMKKPKTQPRVDIQTLVFQIN